MLVYASHEVEVAVAEAKKYARQRGLLSNLDDRLKDLGFGNLPDDETTLYTDFAPHSFSWVWRKSSKLVMAGGLIYYGPADHNGVDGPQYSVRVGETKEGWEIHT